MKQEKPTDPSIIKNWVRTCSVQMDNGEMFHMIEDIMGETTPDEKAEIRHRLTVMSLALKELCSQGQTFQFYATFTREVDDKEWSVSHPEILVYLDEKGNEPQEEVEKALENAFHIQTHALKDIAENYLWKPKIGIFHSVFNEKLGQWDFVSPFKMPLVLPSLEKKVNKMLLDLNEDGYEKYIKVKVNQWAGEVETETIASFDAGFTFLNQKYGDMMEAVYKESKHLTDSDYREFMPRYNKLKNFCDTFEEIKERSKARQHERIER